MAHPISDGPVTVVKVVTPGCYWIKCDRCQGSCRIPEFIRHQPYSGDYYPAQAAQVFVRDQDGFFYHGTVCGRRELTVTSSDHRSQVRKYVVHLTHTFQVIDVDQCDVFPSFGQARVVCEYAHFVSLHNVLPSVPPHSYSMRRDLAIESHERFEKDVREWGEFNTVVQRILENHDTLHYQQLAVINGSMFGQLSFHEGNTKVELKNALASKNIAAVVNFRFENCICTLMHGSLPEFGELLACFVPVASPQGKQQSDGRTDCQEFENYEFRGFTVHESDRALQASLYKEFSINILFTERPGKSDVPIKFVSPNDAIVLGTVFTPSVTYYEERLVRVQTNEFSSKLSAFFRSQQHFSDVRCLPYDPQLHASSMPPSSDSEGKSTESSSDEENGLLSYEFEEALKNFIERGGKLDSYSSFKSIVNFLQVRQTVELSFELLDVDDLLDWQKVCLPSMIASRNVLIVGPESVRKMTTSLVCITCSLKYRSSTELRGGISPSLIVFVPNYKRAYHVAHLCAKLSKLKSIVSSSSLITETQKEEALTGCDILITTLGNWTKLSKDFQCFDYLRLAYVVFDSFEQLNKHEPAALEDVFKSVVYQSKKSYIQTFILSNVGGNFLVDYFKSLENPTLCVTDIVQTTFDFMLVPNIVFVSDDDCLEQLQVVIQNHRNNLRLLLCSDHHEVSAIRTSLQDSVLYVDENENRQKVLKTIDRWKSNESTFLVASDILLKEIDFIKKANLLVCWMQKRCSRELLVQRFMSIRGHGELIRPKIPVFIFCDRHNLDELIFIKNILATVKRSVFVGGTLDDCIQQAFKSREDEKTNKHCPQLCMFGRCDQSLLCAYRHQFRPEDTLYTPTNNIFLKIDLEKLHNAFHCTVRIVGVTTNYEKFDNVIKKFRSSLPTIEKGLQRAFRESCELKSKVNLSIGCVVGARVLEGDQLSLRRVKILRTIGVLNEQCSPSECEVEVLDYCEPNKKVSPCDLFRIPSPIQLLPRDVIDIFVSKLEPSDFNSDWVHETNCVLENFARLLTHNSPVCFKLLAGPVEVILDRCIIVESIHWYKAECDDTPSIIVDASSKELLLRSKFAVFNSEHINRLSEIAVECGKPPIIRHLDGWFGFRNNLPSEYTKGVVSAYDDPGLFYVQLEDENDKLEEFENRLTAAMNKFRRHLPIIVENELCALEFDNVWNRAIVLDSYVDIAHDGKMPNGYISNPVLFTVLFVDHGDTRLNVSFTELYCLPDEFLDVPYFAVACMLVGIVPYKDDWRDEDIEAFRTHVRTGHDETKTLNIKFFGVKQDKLSNPSKFCRYQVALLDPADRECVTVNNHLVRDASARWDEETVNLLIPTTQNSFQNRVRRLRSGNVVRRKNLPLV